MGEGSRSGSPQERRGRRIRPTSQPPRADPAPFTWLGFLAAACVSIQLSRKICRIEYAVMASPYCRTPTATAAEILRKKKKEAIFGYLADEECFQF